MGRNLRTARATLALIVMVVASLTAVPTWSEDEQPLDIAKELYEAGDYIASIDVLEAIDLRTAEIIYWLWKNEKEIGRLADPGSKDPASPQHQFYLYAQTHPEYLTHDEVHGGEYIPTRARYDELTAWFPRSEYAGTVLFELLEYDNARRSADGVDAAGRLALISGYQRFLNRYTEHPYAIKAKEKIEALEKGRERVEAKDGGVGGESMLQPYEERFGVDQQLLKLYVSEWLQSGWYREYPIEVLVGTEDLDRFTIPGSTKTGIQNLLDGGNLIVMSEAAFQKREWHGPKFLVFEPKGK